MVSQTCSKLPEMARKLIENFFEMFGQKVSLLLVLVGVTIEKRVQIGYRGRYFGLRILCHDMRYGQIRNATPFCNCGIRF